MKSLARLAGAVVAATLAACQTTGDPSQGGLFGWSEGKAQDRQIQKRSAVAGAENQLSTETSRGAALENRQADTEQRLTVAAAQRTRTEDRLKTQQARILAKVDALENDSPTAATASRARSYRVKANTIAAQTSLSPQQRAERLHAVEAEIDRK